MVGINIKQELKDKLDYLRQHPRDTYGLIIEHLIKFYLDSHPLEEMTEDEIKKMGLKDLSADAVIGTPEEEKAQREYLEKQK